MNEATPIVDDQEMLRAYAETIRLKDAEIERLKEIAKGELSPDEAGYLLGLLKEHLAYYRTLAGTGKCSQQNRARLAFLEALWLKLVK